MFESINKELNTNTILDSVADGVFTIDLDYKITSINAAATKILGIKTKDAIGRKCFDVFHASICESACVFKEILNTKSNIIDRHIFIVNSDGDKIPISVNCALLRDKKNKISGIVETFRDLSEIEELKKEIESNYSFEDIVSKNKHMHEIFSIMPDIAESDSSVLIQGNTGTGKELIAQAIHNLSNRYEEPFIIVNCAALPDTLLESELFGYTKGAFTDAKKDKPGKIAVAEGGTLFLDEIGEISPMLQVKLLRYLQTKIYEPLGSNKPIKSNVRIVSATNKNLKNEIENNNFRNDLYYRLNIVNIELPDLKNRNEDIPILIKHFIKKFNVIKNKQIKDISDEVYNILLNHDYPGNIRELENIIEHCFALTKSEYIEITSLPKYLSQDLKQNYLKQLTLLEMEKEYIQSIIEQTNGNKAQAAKILDINYTTLWRKLKKNK
jgi:PAS domain S-box-containing protein